MNVKREVQVLIEGNYWNYYPGYVVYEKVEHMMPREYYKDKDEYIYNYGTEWTLGFKERNGHNLRYDTDRAIQNQNNMKKVMEKYGEFCEDWLVRGSEQETDEPIGVYLEKEPYFSTQEDKQKYYDYWASQECGLD